MMLKSLEARGLTLASLCDWGIDDIDALYIGTEALKDVVGWNDTQMKRVFAPDGVFVAIHRVFSYAHLGSTEVGGKRVNIFSKAFSDNLTIRVTLVHELAHAWSFQGDLNKLLEDFVNATGGESPAKMPWLYIHNRVACGTDVS